MKNKVKIFEIIFLILIFSVTAQKNDWSLNVDPCQIRAFEYTLQDQRWCQNKWQSRLRSLLGKRFNYPQSIFDTRYTLGAKLTDITFFNAKLLFNKLRLKATVLELKINFFLNDSVKKQDILEAEVRGYTACFSNKIDKEILKQNAREQILQKIKKIIIHNFPYQTYICEKESLPYFQNRPRQQEIKFAILRDYWQDKTKAKNTYSFAKLTLFKKKKTKTFFLKIRRMLGTPYKNSDIYIKAALNKFQYQPEETIAINFYSRGKVYIYILNIMQNKIQMIFPLVGYTNNLLKPHKSYQYPYKHPDFPFYPQDFIIGRKDELYVIIVSNQRINTFEQLLNNAIVKAQNSQKYNEEFDIFVPLNLSDIQRAGAELLCYKWQYATLFAKVKKNFRNK